MSLINITKIIVMLCILLSCNRTMESGGIEVTHSEKNDSLIHWYNNVSSSYLQPSINYRLYKDSALLLDPSNVEIRQVLSYSYKKKGEHIGAMKELNRAVANDLQAGNVDALEYRAWSLLYYYRDYKGTIKDITLIEEMTEEVYNICWGEPCLFQKGQAYYKLKDYTKAIEAFDILFEEEKKQGFAKEDSFWAFFYKGRCLFELGNFKDALLSYNQALMGVEDFPEAHFEIGRTYNKMGNIELAKKCFEKAKACFLDKMEEPYIERFDEVFMYQIDEAMLKLKFDH